MLNSYLKEGKGEDWAGQSKAIEVSTSFLNANKSISEENLGFAVPIGSIQWYDF